MNCEKKPSEYEFDWLVFGVNSSPFWHSLCVDIMLGFMNKVTRAAKVILKFTYMDNSMASVLTDDEAICLCLMYGEKQESKLINGFQIQQKCWKLFDHRI